MLIWIFLVLSCAAASLYMYFSGGEIWKAVILLVGCFFALNILYLVILGIVSLFINDSKPLSKQNAFCRIGCVGVASLLTGYGWVRTHISGMEKLPDIERFLLVCNHRSMYDPLIIMDKLRNFNISFISKPSNMELPVAGKIAYGAGCLAIDRENDRNALRTVIQAADYLKRGLCSMAIYPEGTRSKSCELLPFHAGSFKIAQKAEVPLVVAAVRGTEMVKKNLLRRVTDTYLDILEVIPAEKVKSMTTVELSTYSRGIIEAHLSAV